MTVEVKDYYPRMSSYYLTRLMNQHRNEVEIWEREHALAKSRGITAEIARIAARVQRAKVAAKRAEVSLLARDTAWEKAS